MVKNICLKIKNISEQIKNIRQIVSICLLKILRPCNLSSPILFLCLVFLLQRYLEGTTGLCTAFQAVNALIQCFIMRQ